MDCGDLIQGHGLNVAEGAEWGHAGIGPVRSGVFLRAKYLPKNLADYGAYAKAAGLKPCDPCGIKGVPWGALSNRKWPKILYSPIIPLKNMDHLCLYCAFHFLNIIFHGQRIDFYVHYSKALYINHEGGKRPTFKFWPAQHRQVTVWSTIFFRSIILGANNVYWPKITHS